MKVNKVSSKKLLAIGILGTAFLSSCHTYNTNQGQSGNGTASTSGYTLTAQAVVNPPVYSVQASGSTYTIPTDTWYLTVNLSYSNPLSSSSSQSSISIQGATIQSADICFGDPTIPGGECQTVSLSSNSISTSSPLQTSFTLPDVYKLGVIGLSANPFQNQPDGVSLTVPLVAESTTSLTYAPVLTVAPNLVSGSLNVGYTVTYTNGNIQTSVTSITNIYNSGTLVSSSTSTSSSNYVSSTPYSISGFCVDSGSGYFTNSKICSGSINYTQGVVSSFSLLIPSTTTLSSTQSSVYSLTSSSVAGSTTTSSSTQIINITSSTSTYDSPTIAPTLTANYVSASGQVSGSIFSAIVNTPTSSSSGQSYSTYYVPSYVVAGSNTVLCTPSICSLQPLSPGVYSLNINLANSLSSITTSSTSAYAVIKQYITFNPSVFITQTQPAANLPYTLYLNVLLPNGQTLSTSYRNQLVIQNPY
jgi:hypothetical protein